MLLITIPEKMVKSSLQGAAWTVSRGKLGDEKYHKAGRTLWEIKRRKKTYITLHCKLEIKLQIITNHLNKKNLSTTGEEKKKQQQKTHKDLLSEKTIHFSCQEYHGPVYSENMLGLPLSCSVCLQPPNH